MSGSDLYHAALVVPTSPACRCGCVAIMLAAFLASPSPALAHVGGRISTSYEAKISGFSAQTPGVAAQVLGGDLDLQLRVAPPHVVVVLGLLGEPFLRFSPGGVQANRASPTASSAGVLRPGEAVRADRTVWTLVSTGSTFTWHENRLRPLPVRESAPSDRPVARWRIPLIVDGRHALLSGAEWFRPSPSLVPWVAGGLVFLFSAIVVAYTRRERVLQRAALILMAIASGAWMVGWDGILLDGRWTTPIVALALAWPLVSAAVVAAVVSVVTGNARMVAAALVGAIAATFTVPELPAFTHGFVLSALGDMWARVAILGSFVGGIAVVVVCTPAIVALFNDDPLRRRLLAPTEHGPADHHHPA
ncbi:MAG: hypothetical protein ACRDLL_11710 [Solirubrobacterales bacterium]